MKKFAKVLSLMLAVLFVVTSFVACNGDDTKQTTKAPSNTSENPPETTGEDEIAVSLPEDLNFSNADNNTITFFTRNSEGNVELFDYEICCEELMKDTLYDAIHYRNIDVENRLGVKIKQIGQAGGWSVSKQWFETLATAVNTQSSDFDAAAMYSCYGAPYALQNLYYNLNEVSQQYGDGYIDLEKPWWNQSVIEQCTLFDNLYFLTGDLAVSGTYGAHLLWFNKDLFDEKFPTEGGYNTLYDYVDAGTWTIDKMSDYVSQIWDDVNSSGSIDDGDTIGLKYFRYKESAQMESWTYAMGIEVLERDKYGDYYIANFAAKVIPAVEKVHAMYNGDGAMISDGTRQEDLTALGKGNVLFQVGGVNDGNEYRGTTVNYGALPMPKYNEEQEEYANGMWTYTTFLTILNHLSKDRAIMVSAVLELLSAESYKTVTPAYYSKVITGQYSKEENDARMLDLAVRTCKYAFEQIYSTNLDSKLIRFFSNLDTDPQVTIDANINTTWPTKLEELLDGLEAIA